MVGVEKDNIIACFNVSLGDVGIHLGDALELFVSINKGGVQIAAITNSHSAHQTIE